MVKSSVDRYGSISQLLHWCTAIVVLIWFAFYFLVFIPRGAAP